ncbi:MAG: hypothetical protein HFF50_02800 [Lawsonibacter sp.]|nr:hypothetical protein [Lawsonibacter sp.]
MKWNKAQRQGFVLLLLALGLIVGSFVALRCILHSPGIAVMVGMVGTVCALCIWAVYVLIWLLAPERIAWKRLRRGMLYLSPYRGSGRLLEEYQAIPEDAGEDAELCQAALAKQEGGRDLILAAPSEKIQRTGLTVGDQVLLVASGLFKQVWLVGTLEQIQGPLKEELCTLRVRLSQGLLPDKRREFLL